MQNEAQKQKKATTEVVTFLLCMVGDTWIEHVTPAV